MRNEKLHRSWHNEFIPTIEETIKMIDMWLNFKNSQPCPNAPDKTIAEVLSERKRQNIDINTLDDLMLATEVKTIQRNGIRFLNCDYFDERLYGFKSKVLIKYNLFDLATLRDIHDETGCPIIFIGMGLAHRKLERYKHLYDRFSEILKFETFGVNDLSQIIAQLSEVPFTPDAIEYIHTKFNRFRQIVQLINQMEIFSKDNNITEINMEVISQIV